MTSSCQARLIVVVLVTSTALIRSARGQFNLLLNENETQRLFSSPSEMYYVRNDVILQKALGFFQLPFTDELSFTWFSVGDDGPIRYHLNVSSSHTDAFNDPLPDLARVGLVPQNRTEFRVTITCTGKVGGEFQLEIELAVSSIASVLRFSRRKRCYRHDSPRMLEAYELSELNVRVLPEIEAMKRNRLVNGGIEQLEMDRVTDHISFISNQLVGYLLQDNRKRLIMAANMIFVFAIVTLVVILSVVVRKRLQQDRQFIKEINSITSEKQTRRERKKRKTKKRSQPKRVVVNRGEGEKNGICMNEIQALQLNALLDDISSSSTTEDELAGAFGDSDSSDSSLTKNCYQHFAYVQRTVAEPWSLMSDIQVSGNRVKLLELIQSGTFSRVYHAVLLDNATIGSPMAGGDGDEMLFGKHVLLKTVTQEAHREQINTMLQNATLLLNVTHSHISPVSAAAIIDSSAINNDNYRRFITESDRTTVPCLMYEYADVGNLKLFLAELRLPESRRQRYTLTTAHIVNLATQLCKAVHYLHRAHIIHKDIATRNCVINSSLIVKLTDNVVSRDLFPDDYSCIGDNENRPVKWLALEALIERKFSTATDVWSFGVTLWELITRAQEPYFDIDAFEMIVFLRDGRRLEKPKNCPLELYDIMMSCWLTNPENRPTPAFILNKLKHFAVMIGGYL